MMEEATEVVEVADDIDDEMLEEALILDELDGAVCANRFIGFDGFEGGTKFDLPGVKLAGN